MKKLLALVLAMVMTLGLATVGTNAVDKFADNDSIKFTEAATVMKAIGVFDGDESGNFRPTDTLKRSEAAKIVAYLMLTKKTADNLIPSGTRYVDVPSNHWAAGYIEYLTSEGVLGGVGNGMFNPDGDITGIDFAKMLLVALGYDAKLENLVLSDYRINTAKLANSIDLFEGNTSMVPTAAITRDEAVLYAFNMIKSPMVEYDSNVRVETGNGGAVTVGNNRAYQKTSSNFTKQTVSLKEAARNDRLNTNTGAQYLVEFAEEKYTDLELVGRDVTADTFGRPARKWLYKNVDLGTYVQTKDLVTTWNKKVTSKMVYDQLGKTIYDSLKDGYSYLDSWKDGVARVVNSYVTDGNTISDTRFDVNAYINRDNTTKINDSGNGTVTELYMDKDKNVTIVTMNTFVYKASADYNKNSKTLRITPTGETEYTGYALNSNELKLEDFADIENYKTDDYFLARVAWNGSRYEIKEIEKAEVLSGIVDSYTTDGSYSVTIDGTKHDYAVTAESTTDETRTTMYSVGKEAKVVVDKNGYIYAVDEAIVTSDYVFISKFGTGNSTLKTDAYASAYFTDGTDSTIKLKSVVDLSSTSTSKPQVTNKTTISDWGDNSNHAGKWYTYSKNASGEYTLYDVQKNYDQVKAVEKTGANAIVMYDGQVNFVPAVNTRADDKTIVVVNDDAKSQINVYTGVKNIPGIKLTDSNSSGNVYILNNNNDVAKVVYVGLKGGALVTGSANDNLMYVIKADGSIRTNDEKKETRWQYKVLKNDGSTDEESIVADNQIAVTGTDTRFMVANYASKNSDGLYTRFYNVNDTAASSDTVAWGLEDGTRKIGDNTTALTKMDQTQAPISYKNGALTVGGQGWTLADDAKITVVGVKWNNHSGQYINTDRAADYEVHAWISPSELNGMFNGLSAYTYDFALRTTGSLSTTNTISNSGRSTVKELFITVWTSKLGSGTTAGGTASSAAVTSVSTTLANAVAGYTGLVKVGTVANGVINNGYYVPSLGRIYFTVDLANGVETARIGDITVTEAGTFTTTLSGVKSVSEDGCYYFDYDPAYDVTVGLELSASYVDKNGKTASSESDYVQSWTVKPSVTPASGTYTITPSTVTISNVADSTFSITVKRAASKSNATTWSLSGTSSDSNVTFTTASGTGDLTITGTVKAAMIKAPTITLTAENGGYTVSYASIDSSKLATGVKSAAWASTSAKESTSGSAKVVLNVTMDTVASADALLGSTISAGSATVAKLNTSDIVVSGKEATITFTVSGISADTTITLTNVGASTSAQS